VHAREAYLSPRLAGFVLDAFGRDTPTSLDAEFDQLTRRELEALQLIAAGYTNKEIAARLSISVRTVETHTASVLRKLRLSDRKELTRWARHRRL
jgi:DNA-binding NarL/FixJ family response regulator